MTLRERENRFFVIVGLVLGLAALVGMAAVIISCDSGGVTGPTNKVESPAPAAAPATTPTTTPTAEATPDPRESRSYITFGDGCAGTWCAVKGSAKKVSIIATVPGKNDAASIYGEWFIEAKEGECVEFGRAEQYLKFPWCGEQQVQCDASLGYGGGAHAGHIFTNVRGYQDCPCEGRWQELEPETTTGEWGDCGPTLSENGVRQSAPACSRSRVETTIIREQNTCTKEIREKSREEKTVTEACECEDECEAPFAGSLPAAGSARLTFIAKDSNTGLYVWRVQNNTSLDRITVKGPGVNITFAINPATIGFFTLGSPAAGLSIYNCEGTKLHGTASSNETAKDFCEFATLSEEDCPEVCQPTWVERPPVITEGEWGQCAVREGECGEDAGEQSRTITTIINEQNSCTEEIREKSRREEIETRPCDGPECPGACYYNVSDSDGKEMCMALPGFVSWNEKNHLCALTPPGHCSADFNLNPGQSGDFDCYKHTGGDQNCNGIPDSKE